jgi:hypothetical protein
LRFACDSINLFDLKSERGQRGRKRKRKEVYGEKENQHRDGAIGKR